MVLETLDGYIRLDKVIAFEPFEPQDGVWFAAARMCSGDIFCVCECDSEAETMACCKELAVQLFEKEEQHDKRPSHAGKNTDS